MAASKRCAGKRRMQRGSTFGLYKCGRKATTIVTTTVGLTRKTAVCDGSECWQSVTNGYPASGSAIS